MYDKKKFVIEQVDEALEERQNSDRRKANQDLSPNDEDRRKFDRRASGNEKESR